MISSATSLLLLGGAVWLFARKRAGHIAVALGTGIITLATLVGIGATLASNPGTEVEVLGTALVSPSRH
jgi:hypothetical protein